MMILFWILIIFVLYEAFDHHKGADRGAHRKEDAADEALKMRYVNGEIDEETYKRMKEMLK